MNPSKMIWPTQVSFSPTFVLISSSGSQIDCDIRWRWKKFDIAAMLFILPTGYQFNENVSQYCIDQFLFFESFFGLY